MQMQEIQIHNTEAAKSELQKRLWLRETFPGVIFLYLQIQHADISNIAKIGYILTWLTWIIYTIVTNWSSAHNCTWSAPMQVQAIIVCKCISSSFLARTLKFGLILNYT